MTRDGGCSDAFAVDLHIRIDFFLARRPHCNALPSPLSRAEKVVDLS